MNDMTVSQTLFDSLVVDGIIEHLQDNPGLGISQMLSLPGDDGCRSECYRKVQECLIEALSEPSTYNHSILGMRVSELCQRALAERGEAYAWADLKDRRDD